MSLRVAMIGYGFMGAAHSVRVACRLRGCSARRRRRDGRRRRAQRRSGGGCMRPRWGWAESATDWREVIARDDIDVIDIVTPGDTHAEIAIAALEAGKHVLCEKPLANTVAEAEAMADAAARAAGRGIRYRWSASPTGGCRPTTFASGSDRSAGASVTSRQVRAAYRQDWLIDAADAPWRGALQKEHAGSGALGDIGAHIIDMTQYVTGLEVTAVSGVHRHDRGGAAASRQRQRADRARPREGYGEVTVDDIALFTGRLDSGALASFEATRFRTGRKNALRIEISGSKGAIAFDLERLNELEFYDATLPPRSRASSASSSPRARTPTSPPGGPPDTCSATSTGSATRCTTSSRRSARVRSRGPRSRTDCMCSVFSKRSSAAPVTAARGSRPTTEQFLQEG
jgi:predicted dehydrogenase